MLQIEIIERGAVGFRIADKHRIYGRTNGHCFYCGLKLNPPRSRKDQEAAPGRHPAAFTIDHVIAESAGGTDSVLNLVPACHPCNAAKGDRSLGDWLEVWRVMRALRAAGAPSFSEQQIIWLESAGVSLPHSYEFWFEANSFILTTDGALQITINEVGQ